MWEVLLKATNTNWTSPDSPHFNITGICVRIDKLLTDKRFCANWQMFLVTMYLPIGWWILHLKQEKICFSFNITNCYNSVIYSSFKLLAVCVMYLVWNLIAICSVWYAVLGFIFLLARLYVTWNDSCIKGRHSFYLSVLLICLSLPALCCPCSVCSWMSLWLLCAAVCICV